MSFEILIAVALLLAGTVAGWILSTRNGQSRISSSRDAAKKIVDEMVDRGAVGAHEGSEMVNRLLEQGRVQKTELERIVSIRDRRPPWAK